MTTAERVNDAGKIATTLGLLSRAIKSGENWDQACEQAKNEAFDALRRLADAASPASDAALQAECQSKSDQIGKLYRVCNERDILRNVINDAIECLERGSSATPVAVMLKAALAASPASVQESPEVHERRIASIIASNLSDLHGMTHEAAIILIIRRGLAKTIIANVSPASGVTELLREIEPVLTDALTDVESDPQHDHSVVVNLEQLRSRVAQALRGVPASGVTEEEIVWQHIGWLKLYFAEMSQENWRDLKLRCERQLDELVPLIRGK